MPGGGATSARTRLWRDKLKSWAFSKLKALGRKVVSGRDAKGVETIDVGLERRDVDGDGDQDFVLHTDVEDDDGDGVNEDPLEDTAEDEGQLRAEFERMIEQQHQWLVAHGR